MFKVEQQEYLKEKLDWSYINFNDNQECLALIEQKPLGILSLLDEECRFPKASASTFALKLKQNHSKNKYAPRFMRVIPCAVGRVRGAIVSGMQRLSHELWPCQVFLIGPIR